MKILKNRQPISRILADKNRPEQLRNKLELVVNILEFARKELKLPTDNHYLTYVDLKRRYAVWNVFAAPEFSLTPRKWWYPVIGYAAYRGYFSQKNATDYAEKLKRQGYDVFVSGVTAYSTLGWFEDPILSTFLYRSNTQLAALIFHELAHQILYVADDTTFNESFATTVEQEGVRRLLNAENNPSAYTDYRIDYKRRQQFIQLIMKYRDQLKSLYDKDLPAPDKRRAKKRIFDKLREEYKRLKKLWEGYSGYDGWFSQQLNNAQLLTVSTYCDLVPAFFKLLHASGDNLDQFYGKCRDLANKSKKERNEYLMRFQPVDSKIF